MLLNLFEAITFSTILLVGLTVFVPSLEFNIVSIIVASLFLLLFLTSWRVIFTEVLCIKSINNRVLIIGYEKLGEKIATELMKWYGHGFELVGFIDENKGHLFDDIS